MALDTALDNPDALSQRAVGIAPVIVKRLRRHSHSPCEDRHHSYCAHSPAPNGSGSSDCGVAAIGSNGGAGDERRGMRQQQERKSVMSGTSVSVCLYLGCRRIIRKNKTGVMTMG